MNDHPIEDLERRLTDALGTAPQVIIPEGFTARLMQRIPAKRTLRHVSVARIRQTYYARKVMVLSLLLLCAALACVLILLPLNSSFGQLLQAVVFVQLAGLIVGFCFRPWAHNA
jgi:hypothetical protein